MDPQTLETPELSSTAGPDSASRWPLRLAIVGMVALLGVLLANISSGMALLGALGTFLLFALPGLSVGFALFGTDVRRHPESLIFGAAFGIALSNYVALSLGYVFGWSLPIMAGGILALAAVSFLAFRSFWRRPWLRPTREWDRHDYFVGTLMAAICFLFVLVPYLSIGRATPEGHAYAWLFGFDFILRATIANSLTFGLPPDYFHLTGHSLHYYLVAYTLPAFAYSAIGKHASLHAVLLTVQLGVNLLFIFCLYAFLRLYATSSKARLWTGLVAVVGYSYYGWYVLLKSLPRGWLSWLEFAGIYSFQNVSHLYQRLFLVEPQALTGLCVFLFVLLVLELAEYHVRSYLLGILLGIALGVEFGIEGWQGLALSGWFGIVYVVRWLRDRRQITGEYGPLITVVVVCTAIYASYFLLGVYEFSSGKALSIKPYWWALALTPLYFPVEYGPMLVLSLWGIWSRWRQNAPSRISMPMIVLLVLILLQIFFLTAEVLPEFGLLRGNRLLPLLLLAWTGLHFDDLFRTGTRRARYISIFLVLLAVPTCFTDVAATSDIRDRGNVRILRPSDLAACEWIKQNLPESAIVQSEPDYIGHQKPYPISGPIETSLIANFAERRMVLGEGWISSTIIVNSKPIALERRRELTAMFRAADVATVKATVQKYHIDYLYVGTYEQELYPGFLNVLRSSAFEEVYSRDNVHIFKTSAAQR